MKKLLLIFIALMMLGIANAQSNKEEVDLLQSMFGMEKKAMVADFVQVDAAKKDAFWKLYDEYETQRKELGKKRIELLDQYVNTYSTITNEAADAWMKEVIKLGTSTEKLLNNYYNKIKKATDSITAFKFWHIESYILNTIREKITSEIPFVHSK
jgi:hypothetical protein